MTPFNIAMIRFLACMYSQMSFKIPLFIESSLAFLVRADILFLSQVSFNMNIKSLLSTVRVVATFKRAFILFNLDVRVQVIVQMTLRHKRFAAAI